MNNNATSVNITSGLSLPREMTFNDDSVMSVIAYSCLFVVATSGNLIVLITLFRSRRFKSRVNTFIMHLSIADLIVAFIMLPLETAWHITVSWRAGDAACRILMFFRALGFYLSSFVLVTISLDRYFSIVHPLSLYDANKRGKIMLTLAWTLSVAASLPQVSPVNLFLLCIQGVHLCTERELDDCSVYYLNKIKKKSRRLQLHQVYSQQANRS